ncbi:MAG: hypothetical protein L0H31_02510 [Nocardioidaceae bacterium]|nr:hypothetical protein [Kocuria sp.]MDN5743975.1 hypothetical protein [Nocardioidaceae bacterium]
MSTYLRAWVDDWMLNATDDGQAPYALPPTEAATYIATTTPRSLPTAAAVVDWLARGLHWAEPVVYKTSVAGWHAATEHPVRVTGCSYARSGATLSALGLVPVPSAGAMSHLDLLCDAAERAVGESAGVLRPTRGASGLRIFWVPDLDAIMCATGKISPGLHLRAMIESGALAAEATALRLLTDSQVSMDEVRATLTA